LLSWSLLASLTAWAAMGALALGGRSRMQRDRLPPAPPGGGHASLSVIVTARDEAPRIGALLASLLAQDHPDFEVIVVDDRSRDASGEVVRRVAAGDPRVRVLRSPEPPPGWQGRIFAQGTGVARARGDWLLFLSADQRLATRDFLRSVVALLEREPLGGIASIGPFTGTRWWDLFWFRPLANLPAVIGGILLLQRWRRDQVWLIGALGMRRSTYDALGGAHAATGCGAGLFEDYGWARAFAAHGRPARTVYAPALHDVSNWETPAQAWAGLSRWVAGAMTYPRGGLLLGPIFLAVLGAAALAPVRVVAQALQGQMPGASALVLSAVGLTIGWSYARADGRSRWLALLFPLLAVPALVLVLDALRACLRGRVRWRGLTLRLRVPQPPAASFADLGEDSTHSKELAKPSA